MTLEPSESVAVFETALRSAIREVLPDWQTKLTREAVAKLLEKQEIETKKRDGAVASADLLDYTETFQLTSLVTGNWESFKPMFQDLPRLKVCFELVGNYRNPAQHNRQILPFERDLLAGAAQQVRNQVALFRGTSGSRTRYYPLIDSATDHLGRSPIKRADIYGAPAPPRLEIGETVEIRVSGVPARGFDLHWRIVGAEAGGLTMQPDPMGIPDAIGTDVTLRYVIRPEDVGEQAWVTVIMASTSKYHRSRWLDDQASFLYSVNPPEDE